MVTNPHARSAAMRAFALSRFSYGYSGECRDDSGLLPYGFRTYDPANSSWLSPDPARTIGSAKAPLNFYQMADQNPATLRDHKGLMTIADILVYLKHTGFLHGPQKPPIDVLETIQAFAQYRNAPLRFARDEHYKTLSLEKISGRYNTELLHRFYLSMRTQVQTDFPIEIDRIILRFLPTTKEYLRSMNLRPINLSNSSGPIWSVRDHLEDLLFERFIHSEMTGRGLAFARFYTRVIQHTIIDAHHGVDGVFLKDLAVYRGGAKRGDELKQIQLLKSFYAFRSSSRITDFSRYRRALAQKINTDARTIFSPFFTARLTGERTVWRDVNKAFVRFRREFQYLAIRDLHDYRISHSASSRRMVISVFEQEHGYLSAKLAQDASSHLAVRQKQKLKTPRPSKAKSFIPLNQGSNKFRRQETERGLVPKFFKFLVHTFEDLLLPYPGMSSDDLRQERLRVSINRYPEYEFRQPIFHQRLATHEVQNILLNMYTPYWIAMSNGGMGIGREDLSGAHHLSLKKGGAFSFAYVARGNQTLQAIIFDFARKRLQEDEPSRRVFNRWIISGKTSYLASQMPSALKSHVITRHELGSKKRRRTRQQQA